MLASMLVRGRMRETLETLFSETLWVANSLFSFRSHSRPLKVCFSTILMPFQNAIREEQKERLLTAIHLWRIVSLRAAEDDYFIPYGTWVILGDYDSIVSSTIMSKFINYVPHQHYYLLKDRFSFINDSLCLGTVNDFVLSTVFKSNSTPK